MRYLLTLGAAAFMLPAFSQADTTYLYFNKGWQSCNKDTAFYIGKIYRQGELWERQDSWAATGIVQMNATYRDKKCTKPHGTASFYYEDGTLKKKDMNENGRAVQSEFFYESGKKRGEIKYLADTRTEQVGYDEEGNEIPGYIVEREARFPGGQIGWRVYLEQNLDANVAANSGARAGQYPVKVQFVVDKEGNISRVEAIQVPAGCPRCGKEAVRVIKYGPQWEPAIQNNRKVIYQAIQYITFQVVD